MNNVSNTTTIREAYQQASSLLQQQAHGTITQDAQQVCEWMLLHLMGWERAELYMRWNEPFPEGNRAAWEKMLSRKIAGEPVQYIIGEQEFYGLNFHVNSAVLIPRPETELLVEAIVQKGKQLWPNGKPNVADIGTGSGAIPITIAVQMPHWQLNASDISPDALAVAHHNALAHGVEINFHEGDLLAPFIQAQSELDIVVSNPPYIPSADILQLQREVQHFEPSLALDGGVDGLDLYKRLIAQMASLPHYPRLIGLEVGQGQAQQVAALLTACKQWNEIEIVPDLAGIERHVLCY